MAPFDLFRLGSLGALSLSDSMMSKFGAWNKSFGGAGKFVAWYHMRSDLVSFVCSIFSFLFYCGRFPIF
jgi:hypothetical protein